VSTGKTVSKIGEDPLTRPASRDTLSPKGARAERWAFSGFGLNHVYQGTVRRCATNSVDLDRVFQCYVLASLFSTSGVDVLLVMTLALLLFASVRRSVMLLSRGYGALPWVANPVQ